MSTFSERFNEWLKEQGKKPVNSEIACVLDKAAKDTVEDLKQNRETIVGAGQFFMAELTGQTEREKTFLLIHEFAREKGRQEVHRAWRDGMLGQSRPVSQERMKWSTLETRDQALDYEIAYAVAMKFLGWLAGQVERMTAENE